MLGLTAYQDKIFSCSADKNAAQHRGDKLQAFRTYTGQTDEIFSIAYHPDTRRLELLVPGLVMAFSALACLMTPPM